MSSVWKFYRKRAINTAQCVTCDKVLKTGGGTSNLRNHLKVKHPQLLKLADGLSKTTTITSTVPETCDESEEDIDDHGEGSSLQDSDGSVNSVFTVDMSPHYKKSKSPIPSTSSAIIAERQLDLKEIVARQISYERGGQKDHEITQKLVKMICKANLPHNIVDNDGVIEFLKYLAPRYHLPSRNTITEKVTLLYEVARQKYKEKLVKAMYVSFTADLCTVSNSSRGFLVMTAHYLDECSTIKSVVLGVRRMPPTHTAENICCQFEEVFQEFEIGKEKIVSACTDGAANIVAAVRNMLGVGKNVHCIAHIYNLNAFDALEDAENIELDELIKAVKKLVTFSKQSNVCADLLRAEQQKEQIPEGKMLTLIQSVATRWNSVYYMLESFKQMSQYVAKVLLNPLIKNAPPMLQSADIGILEEVIALLKPLESATNEISGSTYVTSSVIIPMNCCLYKAVDKVNVASAIGIKMKAALLQSFVKRHQPMEVNCLLCRATILDPRFKKRYMNPLVAANAIADLAKEIKLKQRELGTRSSPELPAHNENKDDSLWESHDDEFASNEVFAGTSTNDSTIPEDLKLYLQAHNRAT